MNANRQNGTSQVVTAVRAAIYTRVSTLEQGEHGYGLDVQLKDCRRLADEMGADVVATFEDRDSGASWKLLGLNAMLDAAQRGEFDTVIIYDPDRLSRRMAKYVVLEDELKRAGVQLRFVTIRAGNSPEDRALQQMKAVFAELDYERITLRLMRGKRQKAERGLVVGTGVAPYGYRYIRNERGRACGLEVDPDAAAIVARFFRDVQRMSLRAVCDRLNSDGVPTYFTNRTKTGWGPPTIQGILDNPVYLGTAAYGRRDGKQKPQDQSTWLYSAAPAIVDRATWDAAHEGLRRRKVSQRRPPRSLETEASYPLRGMLVCGYCGGALQCDINAGYRYYMCLRSKRYWARRHDREPCPMRSLPSGPLDDLAWRDVVETITDIDRLRAGVQAARAEYHAANGRRRSQLDALDANVARLRGRLDRILDEQLDAPAGSETARALREKARQIEEMIGRQLAERARLDGEPTAGLSDDQADSLLQFSDEVRAGIDVASEPGEAGALHRRRVFQLLRLRGTVRLDPEHGVPVGVKHRVTVEWDAAITLRGIGREMTNIQTVVANATSPTIAPNTATSE
jgi:site-specific DNA recombinase